MSAGSQYQRFYKSLGFQENPFQHNNADQEERLRDYFISPPYFVSVFGNPDNPRSSVVFAPRGGGKSAQRRMLEYKSAESQVLAITYDQFEYPEIDKASNVQLHHHLRRILRFALMALLINLQSQSELQEKLSKDDKQVILKLAAEHLGGIKEADLQEALDSLKSLRDKFKDFWNEWLPAIGVSIQTVLALLKPIANLGGISELAKFQAPEFRGTDSLKYQLKLVVDLSRKLGWKSIYVLVDRVDESALTGNNPKASYELLEPLLRDLQLLEFPGLGFKFFLWDQLQPLCDPVLRKDRIKVDVLDWDDAMLLRLWEKRLEAFSAGAIRSLEEISERTKPYMVDELVYIFAQHSPRDMIRIGERILSEQQELGSMEEGISEQAIYSGIEKFCEDRVTEVITRARVLQELKKVRQVDFTIPYLANEVFREQHASTRQRMIAWREEAAIIEIERIDDPNSKQQRKVKLFALKDIRVAKAIYPELTIPEFLHRKYKRCPNCSASVIRDWGEVDSSATCHDCQFDLGSDAVDNVQDSMRKAIAAARRREYREETLDVEAIQLSLLDSEEFST